MCGIIAIAANRPVATSLINCLKKLEYRGYDSAGLAVIDDQKKLTRFRVVGKVKELEQLLANQPLTAHSGIAHTRWATHGVPSEVNAHPFVSNNEFALVHNGIIENHNHLRQLLQKEGYEFSSATDTEVVVHLLHKYFSKTKNLLQAIQMAVKELRGAYALAIISTHEPNLVYGVRQGSPLVVGLGDNENYIASDTLALLNFTNKFIYLEDGDIVEITKSKNIVYDHHGKEVHHRTHTLNISNDAVERGAYRHYMQKEIMEQVQAISACLEGRISNVYPLPGIFGPDASTIFAKADYIHLVACGTSFHAAMVGKIWLEHLTHLPCTVEVASEFRYREVAVPPNSLFVTLSQSGETADTLAALRSAKKMGYINTLAICNVPGSTMTREADLQFLTRAGVEIGVASTKAFITQLVSLFLLALSLREERHPDDTITKECISELRRLPSLVTKVLNCDKEIAIWARDFTHKNHAIFLGRGLLYPIALEGALKMKEISYIHAEGYPAGELKHGPLALVDHNMPVIASLPSDLCFEKNLSNLQEVRARAGLLYLFTDKPEVLKQDDAFKDAHLIAMPAVHPLLSPILYTIPMQLLAYYVAVLKGTDVDQPRNLAKSVTVE